MAKSATLKDVLYALEYGGETIICRQGSSARLEWSLSRAGTPIDQHTVDAARLDARVMPFPLDGAVARYGWRRAA